MFTNTTPVDAYRGAGRPEATFLVERLVDLLAREAQDGPRGGAPQELHPALQGRAHRGHRPRLRHRQLRGGARQGPADGGLQGPSASSRRPARRRASTSASAFAPTPRSAASARRRWRAPWASGAASGRARSCASTPRARSHVFVGRLAHGQGEETTFAQVVASELGVGVDDVDGLPRRHLADARWAGAPTAAAPPRSASGALMGAIAKIKDKAKIVTAHLLEAAVEDIDYADGKFFVKGSPGKFKTIQDVALMANVAWNYPKGLEPGLEASAFFDPPNFVYPFGAHIAVVRGRRRDRRDQARALRRGGRLRQGHQPDDRRGPDPRRHRPGHRPGALGRRRLRRRRPAPHRLDDGLRGPQGRRLPAPSSWA